MPDPQDTPRTALDEIAEEIREIAVVLLREPPPGTLMSEVWDKALTLHAVRHETEVLPPLRQ